MVVAIPVFIVLFAGMLFLHAVVAKTQKTMLAARYQAWHSAMEPCEGGGDKVPQADLFTDMEGAPNSDVSLTKRMGFATGQAQDQVIIWGAEPRSARSTARDDIWFSQSVHSEAQVFCNVKSEPGSLPGVAKWMLGNEGIGAGIASQFNPF
jgi:hypothetical protein